LFLWILSKTIFKNKQTQKVHTDQFSNIMPKSSNPKPTHQSKWKLDTHTWRWYVWHPKIKDVNPYATLLIQGYAVIRLRMTCNVVCPLETWVVNKHEYVRYDSNRKGMSPSSQSIESKYSYVFKTIHKHIDSFNPHYLLGIPVLCSYTV
jgi:hypothetical protein